MNIMSRSREAGRLFVGSFFGGLLRRPEAGAFLGLIAVLIFFTIFGGMNFLQINGGLSSWLNVAANLGIIAIPVGLADDCR